MKTTISVSKSVKKRLDKMKEKEEHTSLDSVIRSLLIRNNLWEEYGG